MDSKQSSDADLIIINGHVITVDPVQPEVQAIAVTGDSITCFGSNEQILSLKGKKTTVLNLNGALLIPGFIESHGHFLSLGATKQQLDCSTAKNWDEIVARVALRVKQSQPGEWIVGFGWHQEKWNHKPTDALDGYPTHEALSRVSPENPVYLVHASFHAACANAHAMRLASVNRETVSPTGGYIVTDAGGNPIGIFKENAMNLITEVLKHTLSQRSQEKIEQDNRTALAAATAECLSKGITTFHDAGETFQTIDFYKKIAQERKLDIRLNVWIKEDNPRLSQRISNYRIIGDYDNRLTVRTIKKLVDGALGSRSAWMLEAYDDMPQNKGINTTPLTEIKEAAAIARTHGFQLAVHAIGDRANREVLDAYAEAFSSVKNIKEARWRIEHAQHLDPQDIARFGQMGIIASIQAVHCTSDASIIVKRIGAARAKHGAYAWQSLLKSKAIICNGTDTPVERPDPIRNFYASITRRCSNGEEFFPEEKMSRAEALTSYTIAGAYAAFEENIKGSISVGKLADMVVLSKNIMTIPEEEILSTEVLYTIIGGKIKYRKQ
ncbi:MAG: amidohydrolase [Chitinivibrionales bacterium]|nr:amidohydrolase [Chitinivibrionales bacterium]